MKIVKMKYGTDEIDVRIPKKNLLSIIEPNEFKVYKTEEEIIKDALEKPTASARLKELIKSGESVCIVIPDNTRKWQKTQIVVPLIVEEIASAGVRDENIMIISALGAHRFQTKEEHSQLVSPEIADRIKVIDHDCNDKENLTYLGETTRGTPIYVNKKVLEYDHVVLVGGVIYHFLAGFGGGRKTVLPGISSYETIMKNHSLTLLPKFGEGVHPKVRNGCIEGNLLHEDMVEAASFVRPTFLFNVIVNSDRIVGAVAGNYIKAHEKGCEIVKKIDSVSIEEKADLVIASAGGFPKDINMYQCIKTIVNARDAVKEGGTIILIIECSEGLGGNEEARDMILNYDSLEERERELRRKYSISKYVSYYFVESAVKHNLIFVSDINPKLVEKANIKVVKTIDEALKYTYEKFGNKLKTCLMPHAANTVPVLK